MTKVQDYLNSLQATDRELIKLDTLKAITLPEQENRRWNEIMYILAYLCNGNRKELPPQLRRILDDARPEGKKKDHEEKERPERYVMKYSTGTPLVEAILVKGMPKFIEFDER